MHFVPRPRVVVGFLLVAGAPSSTGFADVTHWAAQRASRRQRARRNLFSGIIEELGEVVSLNKNKHLVLWDGTTGEGTELVVRSPSGLILLGAYEGASISINGVCTTAVEFDESTFKVDQTGL